MTLSPSEANDALADIRKTQKASATTYGYRKASPHLILWGVVWMIGYSATWLRPAWWPVWPFLAVAGVTLSIWIGRRSGGARADWRPITSGMAVTAFIVAVFAIMQPTNGAQIGAFIPILVALSYTLVGIWARAPRMLATGIVVAALTVGGFFWLQPYFLPWMAVVGGGALIAGGLWLRTV